MLKEKAITSLCKNYKFTDISYSISDNHNYFCLSFNGISLALRNDCRKINHHEHDSKTAFFTVLAKDYLENFIWVRAVQENGQVLTKEQTK